MLLRENRLRGTNFDFVLGHLTKHWGSLPWRETYRRLLYMPRFLNIEFVAGKCNLKCRMCVGLQSPEYPNRLTTMAADSFRHMLTAATTVGFVTLSSGDSDPLLHPDLDTTIDLAREQHDCLDLFTNGQALGPRTCRIMVESQAVNMINVSIDAATPATYRRLRGASFDRLLGKLEMLVGMKNERRTRLPWLSLSFVAMADNIHELPDFVRLAQRFSAARVYVEDLIGWQDRPSDNRPATESPRYFEYTAEATRLAAEAGISLLLPERLLNAPASPESGPPVVMPAEPTGTESHAGKLSCCSWLNGVWVNQDGTLDPCCLIHRIVDMGDVRGGPLLANEKYMRVKSLLAEGKVFEACRNQRNCPYVQQQQSAGIPLRTIEPENLGDCMIAVKDNHTPAPQPATVG